MSKKIAKASEYNVKFTPTLNPNKRWEDYSPEERDQILRDELRHSVDQTLTPETPAPSPFVHDVLELIQNWKSYQTHLLVTRHPDGKVTFEFYQSKEDPRASIHTSNPSTRIRE
jgi:hypothetical protein